MLNSNLTLYPARNSSPINSVTLFSRRHIPRSIKKIAKTCIAIIPPPFRLGRLYKQTQTFLRAAQWWNTERIKSWQLQKFQQIVEYAYLNVPGYYDLYNEARVKPVDIRSLDDVKLLPLVTKELIRDNLSEFTSGAIPERELIYVSTGGSTGVPFGFFQTDYNTQIESAFIDLTWSRRGWHLGEVSAELRGGFVGSERKFWRYDNYDRTLLLSSYYLTERTYDQYLNKLLEYRPPYLKAYPSSASILADLVLSRDHIGRIDFTILFLASENLYEWQKIKLLSAFPNAKLFSWYGHAEQVILAAMCQSSDQYHIWPFYGFTEIRDEEGHEVQQGEQGELIGTSFWNYATPLIRYRTQDLATKSDSYCRNCWRHFQLLENLNGRLQEIIISRTGRYISMTALNMHSNIFEHVKQFQFHQSVPGKVKFMIIRKPDYSDYDTKRIYFELLTKLGSDMDLQIEFTDRLSPLPNGKFRFLKQELQIKYGE